MSTDRQRCKQCLCSYQLLSLCGHKGIKLWWSKMHCGYFQWLLLSDFICFVTLYLFDLFLSVFTCSVWCWCWCWCPCNNMCQSTLGYFWVLWDTSWYLELFLGPLRYFRVLLGTLMYFWHRPLTKVNLGPLKGIWGSSLVLVFLTESINKEYKQRV